MCTVHMMSGSQHRMGTRSGCLTGCLPHCATHGQARVIEAVCMVSQCTAKQAHASCWGGLLTDSIVAWHQLTCRPSDYLAALYPVLKAESALVRVWHCWILARHLVCPATARGAAGVACTLPLSAPCNMLTGQMQSGACPLTERPSCQLRQASFNTILRTP